MRCQNTEEQTFEIVQRRILWNDEGDRYIFGFKLVLNCTNIIISLLK